MLKKEVTYEDFNGEERTETLYFNISKAELVEIELEHKEGLQAWIRRVVEAEDSKTIMAEFKRIVLLAYGKKSEDGKRFIKNDELREEFEQSNAYSEVFMEMLTDDKAAVAFLKGALPRDMAEAMDQEVDQDKPTGPPPKSKASTEPS